MPRTTLNRILICFPCDNRANNALSYTESCPDVFLGAASRSVKASYFGSLSICKYGRMVFFSKSFWVSVSLLSVSGIIKRSSGIKMFRIATRRVVTMMKNPLPFRDWAVRNLPRNPMCRTIATHVKNLTMSLVLLSSQKRPAFIWPMNFNPVPKSFWKRDSLFDVNFHWCRMINFSI